MKTDEARAFFVHRFEAEGTPERAAQERQYLKSSMEHYGVPVPRVRAAIKDFKASHGEMHRGDLVALARTMWKDDHYEIKSAAIALLEAYRRILDQRDMELLEEMIDQCETWAHVDWIAPHVAGNLVQRFPSCENRLDVWAGHRNFWVRRAAMLALLEPLRKTGDRFDRFARYASAMAGEKEFFIRKAIGWILREVSKKRPELTYGFLVEHIEDISALTFKEGSRKLPDAMRQRLEKLRGEESRGR